MSTDAPYFGIDFGTTYSSMAWYDPKKDEARILLNDYDEAKTPSLVFFGEDDEILVGNDAANRIEEFENSGDPEEREFVRQRLVRSVKRYLLSPPIIPIPGYGDVTPAEVVALILGKLKLDAEENHFRETLKQVVLTCPAVFGRQEQNVLREAARMAGFEEVALFEEPTAAALAVHERGLGIGKGVLIYDLGAGTFDLSVVVREEDGSLYAPMEPRGDPRCGGDDFDYALYSHCDRIAQKDLGRPISLTGDVDPLFLKHCRVRKESLSRNRTSRFSSYLPSESGSRKFRHEVDRETFEGLIQARVEGTVKQTAKLLERAESQGHEVDTVVLIGGSSQVPLVARMLGEALPVKPSKFEGRTHAVALGAAYHAYELWKPVEPKPKPRDEYRKAVEETGAGGKPMTHETKNSLDALARRLRLDSVEAAEIEKEVLGDTVAAILAVQEEVEKAPGLGGWALDNVRDLKLSRTLIGHSDWVYSVAFSPDGSLLASSSMDDVKLWDPRIGELRTLTSRTFTGHLWDPRSGKELRTRPGRTITGDSNSVWTLTEHTEKVLSVAFSPDGRLLASGCQIEECFERQRFLLGPEHAYSNTGVVRLCNPHTGKELRTLTASRARYVSDLSVAFSPDGSLLASGGFDATVKLWDPRSGGELRTLSGHSDAVKSVAFSPDGSLLASGSGDKTIKIWGRS